MKFLTYILFFLWAGTIYGQINSADSLRQKKKYWSVETSVVWPIFPGIYKINFVREVWAKKSFSGEVGFSLNIQPSRYSSTDGDFSEEFVTLFYRQFFWKGFNVEIDNNFAYGRLNNWQGAGVNYESYAIFHDFLGGYRFELLKKHKIGLTILPQAGGGFTSYVNDSWPRAEKPFWEVNLLVGMRF
jgi:hypothetical protein